MSSSSTNSFEFIKRVFPPVIGLLTSPAAEHLCQKNNLSFSELVRPFCTLDTDVRLRDPSGNEHVIKKFRIQLSDVNERPPQTILARKFFNEAVSNATCDKTIPVTSGAISVEIPASVPWFDAWCDTFIQVQYPADHEYCKHLLGCVVVTSSQDPPETLQNLLQSLQQMLATTPSRLPKWFFPHLLKYYVLLHDHKDGDREKSIKFFDSMKTAYGPDHCYYLEINSQVQHHSGNQVQDYWISYLLNHGQDSGIDGSEHGSSPHTPAELGSISGMPSAVIDDTADGRTGVVLEMAQEAGEAVPVVIHPLSPDLEINHFSDDKNHLLGDRIVNRNVWAGQNYHKQHGNCLTQTDVDNISGMIKHLCSRSLLPYIERQIQYLTDIVANKKSVGRSFFSATKRLFGTQKPGMGNPQVTSVLYPVDSPELQLRKLGDLCFMFSLYSLAFQAYHSAKRDFLADQAWDYYAGALEMAALSSYMQGGEQAKKIFEYMDDAIVTYCNTKLQQFATRATLLSGQYLKERGLYGDAAKHYIRMTSEDSDLRSALLLEQASYCFLYSTSPRMARKFAFHMVLAGFRFSKAGQKRHALRCYKQAFQVYENKGWGLAEDHIHYTIGRLAGALKQLSDGSAALARLLSSEHTQSPIQQSSYLKEFLQVEHQLNIEEPKRGLTILPVPTVVDNSVKVLITYVPESSLNLANTFIPHAPDDVSLWSRMEELTLTDSQGQQMIFKATNTMFSQETTNSSNPLVVVNEPIYVQVSVRNTTQLLLPLRQLRALWRFHTFDGKVTNNEEPTTMSESLVQTDVVQLVNLEPNTVQQVVLRLTPLCPGKLHIIGMYYILSSVQPPGSEQSVLPSVPGKQLFTVRGAKLKPKPDNTNMQYYADDYRLQIRVIKCYPLMQLNVPPVKTSMLCGEIQLVNVKLKNVGNGVLSSLFMTTSGASLISLPNKNVVKKKITRDGGVDSNCYMIVELSLGESKVLKPGEEYLLPMWIRAPDKRGTQSVNVLFYYESVDGDATQKYRLVRYKEQILVHDSIQLTAAANRSTLFTTEESVNVTLTAKNVNQIHDSVATEVTLVQLSMISGRWSLNKDGVRFKDCSLQNQESSLMLLRADHVSSKTVSDVALRSHNIPSINSHPFVDFYDWHLTQTNKTNNLDLILCVRWEACVTDSSSEKNLVTGQSHLAIDKLNVTYTWPYVAPKQTLSSISLLKIFGNTKTNINIDNNVNLENAVVYHLKHVPHVVHSFTHSRLCTVKVELILRNCTDDKLKVIVNLPSRQTNTSKTLYSPQSSTLFTWTGRTNIQLELMGRDVHTIGLSATFTSPATYELGAQLQVTAAYQHENNYISQYCRVQSAIIVSHQENS